MHPDSANVKVLRKSQADKGLFALLHILGMSRVDSRNLSLDSSSLIWVVSIRLIPKNLTDVSRVDSDPFAPAQAKDSHAGRQAGRGFAWHT